jgi:protocatechuate 3,4-dioxygenase beta subunit
MEGQPLLLIGFVMTPDCQRIEGVLVDIWQADASGTYDLAGYRLRGHTFTDADGRFEVETIVPGEYPGRTEHIHIKLTPAGGSTLTTQLYFPEAGGNESDGIFTPELLLAIADDGTDLRGTFTFILGAG